MIKEVFMKVVLLVEINSYHEEVIYPQIKALISSNQYDTILLINSSILEDNIFERFGNRVSILTVDSELSIGEKLKYAKRIAKKLKPDLIIFNTAEGARMVFYINLYFMRNRNIIRIMHNFLLLEDIPYWKKFILKRMEDIFRVNIVLAKQLKEYNDKNHIYKNVEYYYNIDYSEFKDDFLWDPDIIRIGIQGAVELKRRDYFRLIEIAKLLRNNKIHIIKFYIIGNSNSNDGIIIKNLIKENALDDYFVYYNRKLSYAEFYQLINQMDFLMPLFNRNSEFYLKYNSTKITSTTTLALAFNKRMLVEVGSPSFGSDLRDYVICYDAKHFDVFFDDLIQKRDYYRQNKPQGVKVQDEQWRYLRIVEMALNKSKRVLH